MDETTRELIQILRDIVLETMDNPPVKPYSSDSYLPPHMLEQAQSALAMLGFQINQIK